MNLQAFMRRSGLGDDSSPVGGPSDGGLQLDSNAAVQALRGIFTPSQTMRLHSFECGDGVCNEYIPDYAARAVEDAANKATVAVYLAKGEYAAAVQSQAGQATIAEAAVRNAHSDANAAASAAQGIFIPSQAMATWDCGDAMCTGADENQRAIDDATNHATVNAFLAAAAVQQAATSAATIAAQQASDAAARQAAVSREQIQSVKIALPSTTALRPSAPVVSAGAAPAALLPAGGIMQRPQQYAPLPSAGLIETDVASAGGASLYAQGGASAGGAASNWWLWALAAGGLLLISKRPYGR